MSIVSEISRISGNISDSLDAVAAKGVTVPSGSTSDDLAGLIAQISGGSTPAALVPEKQVNFIDYDGTIVYSYTEDEFDQVSELPANPSHSGLVARGWNWTIDEIRKQLIQVPGGKIWIGQLYTTASGATEIDIELDDPNYLSPYMYITIYGGTVTIDWGDNSELDTLTGGSSGSTRWPQHTYSSTGRYTIKIKALSGSFRFYNSSGNNSVSILYVTPTQTNNTRWPIYSNSIKAIRCASGIMRLATGSFRCLGSCEYITMPNEFADIRSNQWFPQDRLLKSIVIPRMENALTGTLSYNNYCLKRISLPPNITKGLTETDQFNNAMSLTSVTLTYGLTKITNNMLYQNLAMDSLAIPNTVTSIGNSALAYLTIPTITIPENVTSIGTSGFRYNYPTKEYYFKPTVPPTLGDSNVFTNIDSDCKIYVPSASVNAYKTANIWSTWASYIYAGEDCTGISFNTNSISLAQAGDYGLIKATVTPSNTIDYIAWTSSDTSVATIENGVVTAAGSGTATITATCGSYSTTCTVTVA